MQDPQLPCRTKIVIIGPKAAGKTSLVYRLNPKTKDTDLSDRGDATTRVEEVESFSVRVADLDIPCVLVDTPGNTFMEDLGDTINLNDVASVVVVLDGSKALQAQTQVIEATRDPNDDTVQTVQTELLWNSWANQISMLIGYLYGNGKDAGNGIPSLFVLLNKADEVKAKTAKWEELLKSNKETVKLLCTRKLKEGSVFIGSISLKYAADIKEPWNELGEAMGFIAGHLVDQHRKYKGLTKQSTPLLDAVPVFASRDMVDNAVSNHVKGNKTSICFHVDSLICHNGEKIRAGDVGKENNLLCVIHFVIAVGVVIETNLHRPLRLTDRHLVFSARGLVEAATVQVGDVLFCDEEEKSTCTVLRVYSEKSPQMYVGLASLSGFVIAEGVKCSFVEQFHTVPALYLKIAAPIVGLFNAAYWGDWAVSWLRPFLRND